MYIIRGHRIFIQINLTHRNFYYRATNDTALANFPSDRLYDLMIIC